MGLNATGLNAKLDAWLGRLGSTRLHVLVVETPGSLAVRAAVQRTCAERGWQVALTPADADALVVCGTPRRGVADAVEQLWSSLPGPRVRAEIGTVADVSTTLDGLAAGYRAWDATADPGPSPPADGQNDGDDVQDADSDADDEDTDEDMGGGEDDADDADDADDDMGEMDHDMGGMDMGGMDMSGPGGIALASGADDRDGLEMDVLHLPLGPVLAGWPPGCTLLVTLQGDVIVEVEVQDLAPAAATDPAAGRLDAAAQLLALTGAGVLAERVGRARDARLGLVSSGPDLAGLRRRVERSRVLRWALRRVGPIDPDEHGWPATWAGDAYDRLLRLLEPVPDSAAPTIDVDVFAAALPQLLTGSELSSARLAVASLRGLAAVTAATSKEEVPA